MAENLFVSVIAEESGARIDALLARSLPDFSRSQLQKLIESGQVMLCGHAVKKNYRCSAGDEFLVMSAAPAPVSLAPQDLSLQAVYEDSDVIVVNKPRGMVVHPAPGHPDGTLVNALLFHCGASLSGIGGELRPGIVHRIDKDTSGLVIAAKNDFAHKALSAQLADHSLSRVYEAVVHGGFKESAGTVDRPIGRHPVDRKRMAVTEKNSKAAITHWELIAAYQGFSHVRCKLETGRTHQIRVHMASIGHPLLGDYTYGAPSPEKGLEGQCLHARQLHFIHPRTGKPVLVEAPLPPYFLSVLSKLGPVIY